MVDTNAMVRTAVLNGRAYNELAVICGLSWPVERLDGTGGISESPTISKRAWQVVASQNVTALGYPAPFNGGDVGMRLPKPPHVNRCNGYGDEWENTPHVNRAYLVSINT